MRCARSFAPRCQLPLGMLYFTGNCMNRVSIVLHRSWCQTRRTRRAAPRSSPRASTKTIHSVGGCDTSAIRIHTIAQLNLATPAPFSRGRYDGGSHDSRPLGLQSSLDLVDKLGTFEGVLGFSQGGAMAAQVADIVGARWALLFSPVYVPGRPARCSCPTLLAFDSNDEVHAATKKLVLELPHDGLTQVEHSEGHRLPVAGEWWNGVTAFFEQHGHEYS